MRLEVESTVLGHALPGGRGIEDGEEVLDILATSPATARFIVTKLARHFVSDDPPSERYASLVAQLGQPIYGVIGHLSGGDSAVVPNLLKSCDFTHQMRRTPKLSNTVSIDTSASFSSRA